MRPAKKLLGKMVSVEWRDSMTYGRWCESVSDFDDQSLTLQACGFLSHIAHDRIVVSSGRDSSSEPAYCGSLLIPIECVKRVRLLR